MTLYLTLEECKLSLINEYSDSFAALYLTLEECKLFYKWLLIDYKWSLYLTLEECKFVKCKNVKFKKAMSQQTVDK